MSVENIEAEVVEIWSETKKAYFYDLVFIGDSDTDTLGLTTYVDINDPKSLYLVDGGGLPKRSQERNDAFDKVKVLIDCGELVAPKIIEIDKRMPSAERGFQTFLKEYQTPVAIYQDLWASSERAKESRRMTIDEFRRVGGSIRRV